MRPESQASNANSQSGFLGTAARLMTSVLGGSKNRKPEPVKSLQLAAAAAKKVMKCNLYGFILHADYFIND